jgi:hypothetical protein
MILNSIAYRGYYCYLDHFHEPLKHEKRCCLFRELQLVPYCDETQGLFRGEWVGHFAEQEWS